MHTVSYEFLMKPKESAGRHQTLSSLVGSGHETMVQVVGMYCAVQCVRTDLWLALVIQQVIVTF